MPSSGAPVIIKKYANRRLYNTGTSTYVTLEDLSQMVKLGEDFNVQDAKTGDDITHQVLTQIIFELENKNGQTMLPVPFLRQLIAYYGDQMQMIVPSFLEQSMIAFAKEQERFREQMEKSAGNPGAPGSMNMMALPTMKALEEQTRRNMETFQNAMRMFTPFTQGQANPQPPPSQPAQQPQPAQASSASQSGRTKRDTKADSPQTAVESNELAELKAQIAAMQKKLDSI